MPIVLSHNEQIELNLAEYSGAVTLAELDAVATYLTANPSFLKRDCLTLALPDADFSGVDFATLDRLFGRYKTVYAPMSFQIIRRSAWLWLSPAAQPYVDYWIGGRDTRSDLSSTLRQFSSYAEAGDWLVLSERETAMLERGEGFTEIARFDIRPGAQRAATR